MRGEHGAFTTDNLIDLGSSPRARGAHALHGVLATRPGIIPACAGSTPTSTAAPRPKRDHPRVRGEHMIRSMSAKVCVGSSPRARGAPFRGNFAQTYAGIIPACAGSTGRRPRRSTRPRDHPRVRGEHSCDISSGVARYGSSPRARGAPEEVLGALDGVGIIPACAGSTLLYGAAIAERRDHPRVRGEHDLALPGNAVGGGSSPRARGAHHQGLCRGVRPGIIPACAGSTSGCGHGRRTPRDHPRVRGEHASKSGVKPMTMGSSPRARGAQHAAVDEVVDGGIIPACAGSTSG